MVGECLDLDSTPLQLSLVSCHTLPCLLDHQHLPQTYITFIVENHSVVLRCASTCPVNQVISSASSASSASSDPVSFQSTSFCQCRFIAFSLLTFHHFHYPTFFLVFRVIRVLWLRMLIGYLTSSSSSSSTDVFRVALIAETNARTAVITGKRVLFGVEQFCISGGTSMSWACSWTPPATKLISHRHLLGRPFHITGSQQVFSV